MRVPVAQLVLEVLEGHEAFLAVMKEGRLSGAARALRPAQPTVRRRIERIKDALGTPLFARTPRGLVPTAAAERGLPHALALEVSARAFERTAAGAEEAPRGIVRVSASEVVAAEVLPPILAALGRAHPGLVVELDASDANADLLRRDADVAIRMLRPTQAALVARRAATIPVGLFASPGYVAAHGRPEHADSLARHRFVGADRRPGLRGGARGPRRGAAAPGLRAPERFGFLRRVPRVRVVLEALAKGLAAYAEA